jgi:NAD(P)-dependent dehydrogenase (short-subunit alcohol dehydrogenase family)
MSKSTAIVTGGAKGIGEACALRLAKDGFPVAVFDVDEAGGRRTVETIISAGCIARFYPADVTRLEAATQSAISDLGPIEVLVNNAGRNAFMDAALMTEADWDAIMAVDLKGVWMCTRAALPSMRARGKGSIINIASVHTKMTVPGMFPYAAAKMGVVGLAMSLALDEGRYGIRANAVSPGWISTPLLDDYFSRESDEAATRAHVDSMHPMGRIGRPSDVAGLVSFLASDDAEFITGAELRIDGGFSIRQGA